MGAKTFDRFFHIFLSPDSPPGSPPWIGKCLCPVTAQKCVLLVFFARDCKEKSCTLARLGLHPDSPACALDNPLANRKAHAGAWILDRVLKTLEDPKDLLLVLGIYADAVILNGKQPFLALPLGRDMNPRRLASAVVDRVPD